MWGRENSGVHVNCLGRQKILEIECTDGYIPVLHLIPLNTSKWLR